MKKSYSIYLRKSNNTMYLMDNSDLRLRFEGLKEDYSLIGELKKRTKFGQKSEENGRATCHLTLVNGQTFEMFGDYSVLELKN